MLELSNMNVWAIVVAVLIDLVVGSLWYSPLGFARQWATLTGVDMMKMPKSEANGAIAAVAVSGSIQMIALAALVNSMDARTLLDGAVVGLFVWAGFTAATTIGDTLYARRGMRLWWINAGFFLVVLPINAALLAVWR